MATVSLEEAAADLPNLARRIEGGENIVLTRDGRPVLDLAPHQRKGGLDLEAGQQYLRENGLVDFFPSMADDFDDPLPADSLLRRLP